MGLISKDEFNVIKEKLIEEHTRRASGYTVTTPTLGSEPTPITASYNDALRVDISTKFNSSLPDKSAGESVTQTEYDALVNEVQILRKKDLNSFSSDCKSGCMSSCSDACKNSCTSACATGCTSCSGGCGGCTGQCSGACNGCSGSCGSSCSFSGEV